METHFKKIKNYNWKRNWSRKVASHLDQAIEINEVVAPNNEENFNNVKRQDVSIKYCLFVF